MAINRALGFLLAGGILFAADPIAGTWKLNVSKSKTITGRPVPKDAEAVIVVRGDEYEATGTMTSADGKALKGKFTVPVKGGPVNLFGGTTPSISSSMKRVDKRTLEFTNTRDGKVVQTVRVEISRDGKTMQRDVRIFDAQGKVSEDLEIYEKQ
jgi:hypothetical protein